MSQPPKDNAKQNKTSDSEFIQGVENFLGESEEFLNGLDSMMGTRQDGIYDREGNFIPIDELYASNEPVDDFIKYGTEGKEAYEARKIKESLETNWFDDSLTYIGSKLPSLPISDESSFGGYMWNRMVDGTVKEQLVGIYDSFYNWKGGLVGVTIGGNVGPGWLTTAGMSTTYALGTNGEFITVLTPEVGIQTSNDKSGFVRGVFGFNNTVDDLLGLGTSVTVDYKRYSVSATLPQTSVEYSYPGIQGSSLTKFEYHSLPIIELGWGTGKSFGAALTEGAGLEVVKKDLW